ncbi:hypothetical protein D3C71_1362320 [compost metagenome]
MPGSLGGRGQQLGNQVQALGVDVACGVAVVAADVALLGRRAVQQAAGLHEELFDANVGWQRVVAQVGEVGEFFVVGENAFDKGFEKSPLQTVTQ